jgi:hypothetical protein
MSTDLSTVQSALTAEIHRCIRRVTCRLGRYLSNDDAGPADFYQMGDCTLWFYDRDGITNVVQRGEKENHLIFAALSEDDIRIFIPGPWVNELLEIGGSTMRSVI